MNDSGEISYKIIFKSPMIMNDNFFQIRSPSILKIPASILRGATRAQFSLENTDDINPDLLLFFGDENRAGSFFFTDAECVTPVLLESYDFISINRTSGRTDDGSLYSQKMIPQGTEFVGKVMFTGKTSGFQRSVALSKRLISGGVDIILDRLCPEFDEKAPQNEIDQWMTQAIKNSDKVIAILTQKYKQKAEENVGGVGYEYSQLLSERGKISPRLERYIGVLRRGNMQSSVPLSLKRNPIIDMSVENKNEQNMSMLLKAFS